MRVAALILGLLGSLLLAALGAKWLTDYEKNEKAVQQATAFLQQMGGEQQGAQARQALATLERRVNAARFMVGLGLLALVASPFVFKFPKPVGALMALAALVPAALAPPSLLFGFFLLLGALFAFLAKPRAAAA
jgi:hypothetical protein